jgi:uncharacterized membrane protein
MLKASAIVNQDTSHRRWADRLGRSRSGADAVNVSRVERWGSVIGGLALALYGLRRGSLGGAALSVVGGTLVYRGVTGRCPIYGGLDISTAAEGRGAAPGIHAEKTITVLKSPGELYRFWRDFENLPCVMSMVAAVRHLGEGRSHWVAKAPLGTTLEWDAEITEDRENELIAWRSLPGSRLPNDGRVQFRPAPDGRGTQVHVMLTYHPPLGKLGAAVAKLFGAEPGQQLAEDLRRFKALMEAGEVPTTAGQPSGRAAAKPQATSQPRPAPVAEGNGGAVVDDDWFAHAVEAELLGRPVKVCPPEETIWSKGYVMERERYDGADIVHLLRACGSWMDWPRLLRRFGGHWPVLLSHLLLFRFVYPGERRQIPDWVMQELLAHPHDELRAVPPAARICQGTLLSRAQYLIEIERWGYEDARLRPRGALTPEQAAELTASVER